MAQLALYVVLLSLASIIVWLKRNYTYWKKRGVNGPLPWPFLGNASGIMLTKESVHDFARRLYQEFPDEQLVGFYQGLAPALLIRDPQLIKLITVKDYDSFNSRGMRCREDKLDDNLFLAEGETWKLLRQKFNPAFTSAKLKKMMPLVDNCMESFSEYVDRLVESGHVEHDAKDLCRLYNIDVNGRCFFGISMDVYSGKHNPFVDVADNILNDTMTIGLKKFTQVLFPRIARFLDHWYYNQRSVQNTFQFFKKLISSIVKQREGKLEKRGDLMDALIELKKEKNIRNSEANIIMDDDFVAVQAITFYAAGFEPASEFLSFFFFEMARHQDIQQRLFEEIIKITSKYDGKVSHQNVKEMLYLSMVFDEVLRKYATSLSRTCTRTYKFPDRDLTIRKGTAIMIPVPGIHHDSKYYENPDIFNPERFSPENRPKIPSFAYLPFGEGPRHCIGTQLGPVQCLVGAAGLLKNYHIQATARTPTGRVAFDPRHITPRALQPLWIRIARR